MVLNKGRAKATRKLGPYLDQYMLTVNKGDQYMLTVNKGLVNPNNIAYTLTYRLF